MIFVSNFSYFEFFHLLISDWQMFTGMSASLGLFLQLPGRLVFTLQFLENNAKNLILLSTMVQGQWLMALQGGEKSLPS